MKRYFVTNAAFARSTLTNPAVALKFSSWLLAISQQGWDLVETQDHGATTVVIFSAPLATGALVLPPLGQ